MRAGRIEYDGKPALLLHVRDITERRAAEAALQSSEMLFRSVWENSVDGMRLTDENGVIVAVNDAYCKLVGMDAPALEGKPFTVVYAASEDPGGNAAAAPRTFLTRGARRKNEAPARLAQRPDRDAGNHRFVRRSPRAGRCSC